MIVFSLLRLWVLGSVISTSVIFVPGSPTAATSSIVVNPNVLVADGATTALVQVVARDAYNNLAPNTGVALSASGGNTTFASINGATDANGLFQTSVSSTQVQTMQITAVLAGNVTINTPVQLVAGPAVAATSSLNVSPAAQVADNSNYIIATVTLLDKLQHPVSGVIPSFSASGGNTVISSPAPTNSSGQTSVALASTLAQSENVTVSTGSMSLFAPIVFFSGPPTTAMSSVTASPNTKILANGKQATTLTIKTIDRYGNVASNQNVIWSASSGNNTFTPPSGITNVAGVLTAQMTSSSAGYRTVTGIAGAATPSAAVSFTPVASVTASSFVASPNQIASNGNVTANLSLSVKDANNTKIAGAAIKLYDPVGNKMLLPSSGTTDGNGLFTATVSVTQVGQHNISALVTGVQLVASIKGTALPANCYQTICWTAPPWPSTNATSSYGAVSYDFNGDGNQDLAVSNLNGHVNILFGSGNKMFASPVQYSTDGYAQCLVSGDVTGDGHPDLVTCNSGTDNVSVLVGNADGTFQNQVTYPVGSYPTNAVVMDLNGDGYADIATANQNANTVSILFNKGDGTFRAQSIFAAGTQPFALAAGQVANSNANDLIVTNLNAGTVSFLAYAGGNNFDAVKSFAVGSNPKSVVLGDVNGDGLIDAIIGNSGANSVSLLINQGNATFAPQKIYITGNGSAYVGLRALNSNTLPDIVAVSTQSLQFYVFGNNGDGNFVRKYAGSTPSFPLGLGLFDADGDGKVDILLPNGSTASALPIAYNRGSYSFGSTTAYASGSAQWLQSGDYDTDGNADIFVVNSASAAIYWGSSSGAFSGPTSLGIGAYGVASAQADLNGDGTLDFIVTNAGDNTISVILNQNYRTFSTQKVYTTNVSPRYVAIADFDANGTSDVAVSNAGSNNISFYSNIGDGSFGSVSSIFNTGRDPRSIVAADFDADGRIDLAITNNGSNSISLAFNQNNFVFASQANITVQGYPNAIVSGDFNGDGMVDVAVANSGSASLSILLNQNNNFVLNTTLLVGGQPSQMIYQDVNADGIGDLTVSCLGDNAVSVSLGTVSGTFAAPQFYFAGGNNPQGVTLADFNRDGHLDFATGSAQSQTINVALYTGCQ